MTPEIAALVTTGATTLVAVVATDLWGVARAGFMRLFGRGSAAREAAAERRLKALADAVEQAPADDRATVYREQQAVWSVRLADLLDDDPSAVEELRTLVDQLAAQLPAERKQWLQANIARDHGQVFAAQGGNVIIHQTPPRRQD